MLTSSRLGAVLLHPHWLTAALSAALFLQFALNRGGVESAVWAAGLFLVVHAVAGTLDLRQLPRREQLFLAAIAGLLFVSWASAPETTDPGRTGRIVKLAILALAVQHLANRQLGDRFRAWVAAVAVAIVLWQLAARGLTRNPYGTFANPHYIAYFSALLLPVLVLAASGLDRPWRYLIAVVLALDLTLVFNDLHKPTIPLLAIAAGLGAVAWSIASRRARWVAAGLALALGAAAAALVDESTVSGLGLAAPGGDERVEIWAATLRMLGDNEARDWLLGNGIGSFRASHPRYFPEVYGDLTLPHNHVLELLYENGVVLAAVVVGFLGHLGWRSLRMAGSLDDRDLRRLAQCNLALLAIWFVFSFLAFGVYSRYTLYPFGYMLGIYFFLERRADAATGGLRPARDAGPA